jgi:hypothetical protein
MPKRDSCSSYFTRLIIQLLFILFLELCLLFKGNNYVINSQSEVLGFSYLNEFVNSNN